MKITLSWLKDHLETDQPIEVLADRMSAIGLEVEDIVDASSRLERFVVARVVEARPHPNADKLRVCQVDTGKGVLEVVCGAPNARTGMIGVFAPTGTFIPGTGITLEAKPVRGVVSNGMLCSERELEISDEHDGIIELPADAAAHLGKRYVDYIGAADPVLDVKVTPNRPDALGVRGIARDLAACGLGILKPADPGYIGKGGFAHPVRIVLDFPKGAENACPAFASRYIRGVTNRASPPWLQARLKAIGLRPISALVDITNFITVDRARPLHVYDADKLSGPIGARLGRAGESFAALDNKTYEVSPEMTVIADRSGVLGLGGIIGGSSTGCSEATVNVLIESAWFDPLRTAATGRHLGVMTDARYRFERGVDTGSLPMGVDLCTKMILEICGGEASKMQIAGGIDDAPRKIALDTRRVHSLIGVEIPEAEVKSTLSALGFASAGKSGTLEVTIPSWRPDVHGPADLIEEVVRIYGIDRVPTQPMPRSAVGVHLGVLTEGQKRVRRVRRTLAARGLVEAIIWSFISRGEAELFGGGGDELALVNPMSSEMTHMRPSLLPGLLAAVQRNRDRGQADQGLFEVGQVYRGDRPEDQLHAAAGVRYGSARVEAAGRHWGRRETVVDVFDAKADAAGALASLGLDPAKLQITRDAPAWFHPGRSGVFRMGPKTVLCQFGELHPRVLDRLDVDGPVVGFELFIDAVPAARKRPSRAKPRLEAADLHPVTRDFAFVLDSAVAAGELVRAAEGVDRKLIAAVTVFDVFEGESLGPGKKSIAIEVTLQPREKTLTDEEIEAVAARIVAQVKKATGGEIRS